MDRKMVYSQIKTAIDGIYERNITFKYPKYIEEFRWIQYKKYHTGDGSAVIRFSDDVMPYLVSWNSNSLNINCVIVSSFK